MFALGCTSVERVEVHDATHAMTLREANVIEVNGAEQRGYVASSRNGPILVTTHERVIPLRPSDELTVKVRYRPGDVVTPEVAVALRERSVEMIVGGAALFTVGALMASAFIYGAATYKPSDCFCINFFSGAGQQVDEALAAVGVVVFVIGAVLVSVGIVSRASIKSAVLTF